MPEDADPADMLLGGEIERFRDLVDAAIDLPSFRVRTALDRADLGNVGGRERALAEVAPVLQTLGEKTVGRDELVREVADRLDTDPSLVSERCGPRGRCRRSGPPAAPTRIKPARASGRRRPSGRR